MRYSSTLFLLQSIYDGYKQSEITEGDEKFVKLLCLHASSYDSDDKFFSEAEPPPSFFYIEKLRDIVFHSCWKFQSGYMFGSSIPGPILSMRKKADRNLIIIDHVELAESLSVIASEAIDYNEIGFSQILMLQEIASWGKKCIAKTKWSEGEQDTEWESRKQQFTEALELRIVKLHTEIHQRRKMDHAGVKVVITFDGLGF